MSCEQMMEWMQRFVDEDLPQAEQDILNAHIAQCPKCAASFEQLQHLSAELSRLRMISPPFSIVDSILPKLDELDAQQASVQVAYLPEKMPHKKSLFSWKMGAGFVAAAIFFSLIAVNLTPSSKNDASEMLPATLDSNKSQEQTKRIRTTGAADQANSKTTATESRKASDSPEAKAAATAEPKVEAFSEQTDTTRTEKSTEVDQQKSIAPKQPLIKNKSTSTPTKPDPTVSVTFGRDITDHSTKAKIAPAEPSPTPAPIPNKGDRSKGTMYSIRTEKASAPSLASEDGNFIGYVERQTVLVRTPDGSQIYTSSVQWKPTDAVQLIKWEDNAHLTYEVTMEDGQLKRFVIDAILKTEQEQ